MNDEGLSKEQRILRMMRKTLTDVVRDATPAPGQLHPLSAATVAGIRDCLGLIAARERELAEEAGQGNGMRPRFVDEPRTAEVIPLHTTGLVKKKQPPN